MSVRIKTFYRWSVARYGRLKTCHIFNYLNERRRYVSVQFGVMVVELIVNAEG